MPVARLIAKKHTLGQTRSSKSIPLRAAPSTFTMEEHLLVSSSTNSNVIVCQGLPGLKRRLSYFQSVDAESFQRVCQKKTGAFANSGPYQVRVIEWYCFETS